MSEPVDVGRIVLNLYKVNDFPFKPILFWQKKIEPRDVAFIKQAHRISSGATINNPVKETAISTDLGNPWLLIMQNKLSDHIFFVKHMNRAQIFNRSDNVVNLA